MEGPVTAAGASALPRGSVEGSWTRTLEFVFCAGKV